VTSTGDRGGVTPAGAAFRSVPVWVVARYLHR
jgi:hypothetical protein